MIRNVEPNFKNLDRTPSDPSSALISVILVNFNGAQVLPRCLRALKQQTFTHFELIVIDNGSSDGSLDKVLQEFPEARVERLGHNTGFAAANNRGARLAGGRWLALLNTDAFPAPGWLESLLRAAQSFPDYQFFASCILQAHQPERLDSTGDIYHVSGNGWNRDRNRPYAEVNRPAGEVFSACAAAALYDREAFLSVGGFREEFFSYHEDLDLGFRLRLQGHRCGYVPEAVVTHLGGNTFGAESAFTIYHAQRNRTWAFVSNMPGFLLWKYLPQHLLSLLIFFAYYTRKGHLGTIGRAQWDALRGLRRALTWRKQVQAGRKITPQKLEAQLDRGPLNPYRLGKRFQAHPKATGSLP